MRPWECAVLGGWFGALAAYLVCLWRERKPLRRWVAVVDGTTFVVLGRTMDEAIADTNAGLARLGKSGASVTLTEQRTGGRR